MKRRRARTRRCEPAALESLRRRLAQSGEKGAQDAARVLEKEGAVVVDAGAELLRGFLETWSQESEGRALEYLRSQESSCEVIDAVRTSTRVLEQAVERRARIEAGLKKLARELGLAGVRCVLAALVPG